MYSGDGITAYIKTDYATQNPQTLTKLDCQRTGQFEGRPGDQYYCQYDSPDPFGVIRVTLNDDGSASWVTDHAKFATDVAITSTENEYQQRSGMAINLACAKKGVIDNVANEQIACSFTDSASRTGRIVLTVGQGGCRPGETKQSA